MFIIGSLPQSFDGFLRREYTRNLVDGHGDYYPCHIHGLRLVRGSSIQLQCVLLEGVDRAGTECSIPAGFDVWRRDTFDAEGGYPGCGFLAPIEAFCWRVPDRPRAPGQRPDMTYVQPWDTFSETFGIHEFEFHRRMRALILPDRRPARYRCSLDFIGSSLAENNDQHKHLHIFDMDDGSIGAFPNNRVLWIEPAAWREPTSERPDFLSLAGEWIAE